MTHIVQASLGISQLSGKQAIDQTKRFKQQLCSLKKKPEGVSLITVANVDPASMGVVAVYDRDDAVAVEWVKEAEAVSGELWESLAVRRKGAARG